MSEDMWIAAIEHILSRYKDGELISHEQLQIILHYKKPEFTGDIAEYEQALQDAQFVWLSLVDRLKNELLDTYNVSLKNIRGEGYQIIPPKEQTQYATETGIRTIKKELSWMERTITNIRSEALNDTERRENTDAKARLSQLRQMFDGRRKFA